MALCLAIVKCVKAEGRVEACEIMAGALEQYALEWPIAPMLGIMDQASFWADMATQDEAKAYALACYNRLTPANKAAFRDYIGGAK
jgi:antirestriction protein